jgi:hypothetical protein
MSQIDFRTRIATLTAQLAGRSLDIPLAIWLNREHGPQSLTDGQLRDSVQLGIAEGWLCNRETGGIRYGRIFKPAPDLHGFSVDVVDMESLAGPHHSHPNGEIDLVLPVDDAACFDGHGAGWVVYPPASHHSPTVTNGRAYVLYLLPDGRIEFIK